MRPLGDGVERIGKCMNLAKRELGCMGAALPVLAPCRSCGKGVWEEYRLSLTVFGRKPILLTDLMTLLR